MQVSKGNSHAGNTRAWLPHRRLWLAAIPALIFFSCMSGKILSEKEAMVTVVKAGQETTLHLYDTCKASGKADVVILRGRQDNDDEFKRLGAAKGVNVVQILYEEPEDLHKLHWKYNVRYWSCPRQIGEQHGEQER